jgi:hypothetical protein
MKNTKNEVKNPVSTIGFKEVLTKKNSLKLSAIQSKQIDELFGFRKFNVNYFFNYFLHFSCF